MGRHLKIYPSQIEDYLKGSDKPIPVKELSEIFEVSLPTIRKRLKDLRNQGKSALPTHRGAILVEKVKDEDVADLVIKLANWIVSLIVTLSGIASVTKKPLLESRRILQLSKDERRQLKSHLLMLTRTVDLADIDQELDQ